ncbi:hypothetical protein EVG20_g1697 [Dentipellis fragilis]|uniref:Uncharacterized protein n=1 Tax=Dentipellis fragilis TaxID=205917 RepID=A0A4Y9ZBV5_9AGAM|nr:hypothetical protein EVG20_g1697 [Dentipellis fragilis]
MWQATQIIHPFQSIPHRALTAREPAEACRASSHASGASRQSCSGGAARADSRRRLAFASGLAPSALLDADADATPTPTPR